MPRPDGLKSPLTINDHEKIGDPGAWQLWWEFNQDRFLRYSSINTGGSVLTHGTDWELGKGSETQGLGGRLSAAEIQSDVLPALKAGIQIGGSEDFIRSALMTMAKIGGEQNADQFEFFLKFYLNNGQATINETAAVALGLACGQKNYDLLASIAHDTESAQEFLGRKKVPMGMRAFAAYGMGFAAAHSDSDSFRRKVVGDLVKVLEEDFGDAGKPVSELEDIKDKDDDEATLRKLKEANVSDLRVAAMVSIGLIPLEFSETVDVCVCGECVVENPDTCFQSQVTYLMRHFTADEEFDSQVRAHTASTLARLVLAGAEMGGDRFHEASNQIKLGVADMLIESLSKNRKQPQMVQNSAIMALGLMGDADNEDVDRWIRSELRKAATKGDPIGMRFALMGLAEAGSRRGQGDDPWAGVFEVRSELQRQLSRGRKGTRPWAALALGVMGYQLDAQGQELDDSVDKALARVAKGARMPEDLGAYSVAIGLRGGEKPLETLVDKLSATKDETAKSYVALGLGLSRNKAVIKELQDVLEASDREPLVQTRSGLALGLLGDSAVVEELVERLQRTHSEEKKAAIALALGYIGDKRSLDALVKILRDNADPESEVRDAAILAIGYMSDRRSTAWRSILAHGTNYLAETKTLLNGKNTGVLNLK